MNIIMKNIEIQSVEEMEEFLHANQKAEFLIETRKDKYDFISRTLVKFRYSTAKRKAKKIIFRYLSKITGYSHVQMKRLIKEWKEKGLVAKTREKNKTSFQRKYKAEDLALLIKTDIVHKTINGKATKEILKRECGIFKKENYKNISEISVSHIYNLRNNSSQYLSSESIKYSKTNPTGVNIGERRKPYPEGKPGYLRVDSVHQGDLNGEKGVYHINLVDEVTQWEIIGCVEQISEQFLEKLLELLLGQFPFKIINFHSDNGSEYINKVVAKLLNKLLIDQTKSRPRHCNDNPLAEGKNGSIIRKHIGRNHIKRKNALAINSFYQKYFNMYLNYHRPCGFATDYADSRGKIKKKYEIYLTPYEKLKSIENAGQYLKDKISFAELDKIAYAESDNDFADKMKKEKEKIFNKLER